LNSIIIYSNGRTFSVNLILKSQHQLLPFTSYYRYAVIENFIHQTAIFNAMMSHNWDQLTIKTNSS